MTRNAPRSVPGPAWTAGLVTMRGLAPGEPPAGPPQPPAGAPQPPAGPPRGHRLWWFGAAAAAVLVVGLVAVLVPTLSNGSNPFRHRPAGPVDARPPLARLCPSGKAVPAETPAAPARPEPVPSGPRTVDEQAGISYRRYGAPWQPWREVWSAGTLEVPYRVGQHFVTEPAYDGVNDYHASILSAAVPAAENDALTFDLECVGRQVAADVRAEYYPQPVRTELLREGRTSVGGRAAWVTKFRLHFNRPGLRATDELAAVACIDVGRPTAAVFYVSIPGTHRQLDWVVDDALASVRPL